MDDNLQIKKLDSVDIVLPLLLMMLNFVLKGIYIAHDSLAHDEPFSVFYSQFDIKAIINELSKGNNPPFYEIFLHFWTAIFGISELSVRFPSLIFSTVTVIFIYQIGKRNFNSKVAVISALLFIFSNYQIIYAHQARVYALFAMLITISMFYYLELIRGSFNVNYFIALLLSNIIMIYSHYFGFFILFIQFIFIIANKVLYKKFWKILFLSILLISISYLPHIQVLYNRFLDSTLNGTWVRPPNSLMEIFIMVKHFSNTSVVAFIALLIIAIAILRYLFLDRSLNINFSILYIFTSFIFPLFFIFIISYKIPMFVDRYLILVSIPYYIVIAVSVHYIFKGTRIKYPAFILLVFLFVVTLNPKISNNTDMKEVLNIVKSLKTDKSVVYLCPAWFNLAFSYHYNPKSFINANKDNLNNYLKEENIYPVYGVSELKNEINNNSDKIIYVDAGADFGLPNNGILQYLNKKYLFISQYKINEAFKIYEFTAK